MSKVYLSSYLRDIRTRYEEAREKYTELYNDLDEAEKKYRKAKTSGDLSPKGLERAAQDYNSKSAYLRASIEQVGTDAHADFEKIRKKADSVFGDLYRVTPEALDLAGLEILKSGILSDNELLEFAERYEGNKTMTRMIGKFAGERAEKNPGNRELRKLAAVAQGSNDRPHLDAVDTLTMLADKALRMNRMLADGTAAIFDESADNIIEQYGNISVEV